LRARFPENFLFTGAGHALSMARVLFWIVAGMAAASIATCAFTPRAERNVAPPVLAQLAEGGQLICDPYDHATGYQPPGAKVWALNGAARDRVRAHPELWAEIPAYALANTPSATLDDYRRRAASLC
jgi:hypothetical protein